MGDVELVTTDGGATWVGQALTAGSAAPQIRPVAVRGHAPDLKMLWLSGTFAAYNSFNQGIDGGAT